MHVEIENSWKEALAPEFKKDYFVALTKKVRQSYLDSIVYPPLTHLFNAFNLCPFKKVRVVVLGQDPYHGPGQAHGLSFSVQDGVKTPPSLKNIYKEIASDLKTDIPISGNLEHWAHEGVLLLNSTLTVSAHKAGSHQGWGWEEFTDSVIKTISNNNQNVVFMLWGKFAQSKIKLIDESKHLVLKAPHPSPFSAHTGFFGCKHFSQANEYLTKRQHAQINW